MSEWTYLDLPYRGFILTLRYILIVKYTKSQGDSSISMDHLKIMHDVLNILLIISNSNLSNQSHFLMTNISTVISIKIYLLQSVFLISQKFVIFQLKKFKFFVFFKILNKKFQIKHIHICNIYA